MADGWRWVALVFVAVAALFLIPNQVGFVSATENQSTSNVTVSGIVDVTINCSLVNWTSIAPGTNNQSSDGCFPLKITLFSNTNTQTQIFVNGTDLAGTVTYGVKNVTYTNGSAGPVPDSPPAVWRMWLNTTPTSGVDAAGNAFDDWVAIDDPTVDIYRYAYWWITAPSTMPKGNYVGTIYVTISDTG